MKYHLKITDNETDKILCDSDASTIIGAFLSGETITRLSFAKEKTEKIQRVLNSVIKEVDYAADCMNN